MQVRPGKDDLADQSFPPRLGGGLDFPERRDAGRALGAGRLGEDALGGRLVGTRTLGLERFVVAGRALAGVLDGVGRVVGVGRLEVDGRALGAALRVGVVRTAGVGRLRVAGRVVGVGRRAGAVRAFGLGVRVGVTRVSGRVPVRVLNFGGVVRVAAGAALLRGRGRRVFEVSPGRVLPLRSPTSAREPLGTAREPGRFRPLSVAWALGSSL